MLKTIIRGPTRQNKSPESREQVDYKNKNNITQVLTDYLLIDNGMQILGIQDGTSWKTKQAIRIRINYQQRISEY